MRILHVFDDRDAALAKEKEIVDTATGLVNFTAYKKKGELGANLS
jgi:hypothetical protein